MFFEEARDYVAAFEQAVLLLEREPDDPAPVHEMFRAAHSLKGCSATLGVTDVASFTHVLESLLDHMREGQIPTSPELIALLLEASDTLAELIDNAREGKPPPGAAEALAVRLREPLEANGADAAEPEDASDASVLEVRVEPKPTLLVDGLDPLPLLRELHDVVDVAAIRVDATSVPTLDSLEPERCYLRWIAHVNVEPGTDAEAEIREIFEFVDDTCDLHVSAAGALPIVEPDAVEAESLVERATGLGRAERATLRVSADRVDEIINLVGELVIAQAGLSEAASDAENEPLSDAIGRIGRTLHDLQQCALAVRTLPISTVFFRFPRLVRDVAAELGKDVQLVVTGGETELDKSVIEGLASPLTHIVRNAVDHGIEDAGTRTAAGKPAKGTLQIAARQEHGSVVLEVKDDGRGLDKARIVAKAAAAGLIAPGETVSDERAYGLIFEPGFSTAESVSDISGRGVGMDAARDAIEALNGTITVASEPGAGTCVRITLPLTLAILDGFAVEVGGHGYVIPLLSVVEVVHPARDDFETVLGRGELLGVRGNTYSLVRLREVLGMPPAYDEQSGLAVIVDVFEERICLLVDDVVGQATVVIKALDESVRRHPAILGGTIRGDGSIAFILDLAGVLRAHRTTGRRAVHAATGPIEGEGE